MSGALELGRLRAVPRADAADEEPRFEKGKDFGGEAKDEPGGLWMLLDRLVFAAIGAVEGAASGWANPSWQRDDEATRPIPIAAEVVMTRTVQVVRPDARLDEVTHRLSEYDCGALPVVDAQVGRRVIGIITDRDIALACGARGATLAELRVDEVMSRDVLCCREEDSLLRVHRCMRSGRVRRIPVIDGEGRLAGVVSLTDLVQHALHAPPTTRRAEAAAALKTLGVIGTPNSRD